MSVRLPSVLLMLVVVGCGNSPTAVVRNAPQLPSGSPTSSPLPVPVSVSADAACPKQDPTHLQANQVNVTDAFVCREVDRKVPGDGVWLFQVVRRVTSGLNPLLAAYNAPDAGPAGPGVACTAELPDPLVVYLHSDTGVRAVRAPWTECRKPTTEAASAYLASRTTVVWEKKDRQTQTQMSIDSACSDAYKDTLALDETYNPNRTNDAALPTALSGPVSVCTYRVQPDAQGDRIGHLDGHRSLTAEQILAINSAITHVRVDPRCSRHQQTRFALLSTGRGDPTVVALDGCAISQSNRWWRADADLRSALTTG